MSATVAVECDVQLPQFRRRRYPWSSLRPGDSFFVPGKTTTDIAGSVSYARWKTGFHFTTRSERDGVRVWRVS